MEWTGQDVGLHLAQCASCSWVLPSWEKSRFPVGKRLRDCCQVKPSMSGWELLQEMLEEPSIGNACLARTPWSFVDLPYWRFKLLVNFYDSRYNLVRVGDVVFCLFCGIWFFAYFSSRDPTYNFFFSFLWFCYYTGNMWNWLEEELHFWLAYHMSLLRQDTQEVFC